MDGRRGGRWMSTILISELEGRANEHACEQESQDMHCNLKQHSHGWAASGKWKIGNYLIFIHTFLFFL
jgi:hypothetical protein